MKNSVLYKNYLIDGESFQRETHGSWIPQYTLTRQESKPSDFPSHQYQFSQTFHSKNEADFFAVQKAKEWIDKDQETQGKRIVVAS